MIAKEIYPQRGDHTHIRFHATEAQLLIERAQKHGFKSVVRFIREAVAQLDAQLSDKIAQRNQ